MDNRALERDTRSLRHVMDADYKFPMTGILVSNLADDFMITQMHVVLSIRSTPNPENSIRSTPKPRKPENNTLETWKVL